MNLTGIIAISGRPGLYKVVAQGKNNIIVESLDDHKRFPAYSTDRISALDDISIYTYDEDKPLKEIYEAIYEKLNGGTAISHKEDAAKLSASLLEVLPNYDKERVYPSDIKKLFQWYNILHKADLLKADVVEQEVEKEEAEVTAATPKKEKAPAAKKAAPKKAADKPAAKSAAPKATAAKKVAAPKTGSSRGK